jgi:2C-methyl-D-erythritol 2,4-cyclodiphosphate synthase
MVHDEKAAVAIILGKMKPKHGGHMAEEHMEEHPDASLHACAEDLLGAIEAKDVQGMTDALKAFFHIADAAPHEEGPHMSEEEEHGYEE